MKRESKEYHSLYSFIENIANQSTGEPLYMQPLYYNQPSYHPLCICRIDCALVMHSLVVCHPTFTWAFLVQVLVYTQGFRWVCIPRKYKWAWCSIENTVAKAINGTYACCMLGSSIASYLQSFLVKYWECEWSKLIPSFFPPTILCGLCCRLGLLFCGFFDCFL